MSDRSDLSGASSASQGQADDGEATGPQREEGRRLRNGIEHDHREAVPVHGPQVHVYEPVSSPRSRMVRPFQTE